MATVMSDKGPAYVTAWPNAIATKANMSVESIGLAMRDLGIIPEDRLRDVRHRLLAGEYLEEIGALTPSMAKSVIARVLAIRNEIAARQYTHCTGCGLPLGGGDCEECV